MVLEGRHRLVVSGHRVDLVVRFLKDRVLLAQIIQVRVRILGDVLIGEVVGGSEIGHIKGLS